MDDTTVFESREKSQETDDLSECLRASVDVFFDALVKVDVKSTIQVVNYMADKISRFIIHHHTNKSWSLVVESRDHSSSPSLFSSVHWINLLQGFTSSISPSNLSIQTLHLLTFVDILENIKRCKEGLHDAKTFYDLYQLLSCVSWFTELKEDSYYQETIRELQEETRNQELICHYVITKSTGRPDLKKFCNDHPLSHFCKKTIDLVSSVIEHKFNEPGVKVHDEEPLNITNPTETRENDSDEDSWAEAPSSPPSQSTLESTSTTSDSEESIIVADVSPGRGVEKVKNAGSLQVCNSNDNGVTATAGKRGRPKGLRCIKWTPEELMYLKKGVKKYGTNWAMILKMYPFQDRTPKAISERWYIVQQQSRNSAVSSNKQQATPSKRLKQRKKNQLSKTSKIWTSEEVGMLQEAVETYGEGNWKSLLDNYSFNGRSKKAIREKWRTLQGKH